MKISYTYWIVVLSLIIYCDSSDSFFRVDCPENLTAHTGQDIKINCTSDSNSEFTEVKKCNHDCMSCEDVINTIEKEKQNKYALISDMRNVNIVIQNASITDKGCYTIKIYSQDQYEEKKINIDIQAHYRMPQISYNENKMEVSCSTSGGYPESEIHWFDTYDTNWTKSAKTTIERADGGLFRITSILPLKSSSIMPSYRCFLTSGKKNSTIHIENSKHETVIGINSSYLFILVAAGCVAVIILGYLYCKKKSLPFQRKERNRLTSTSPMLEEGRHE